MNAWKNWGAHALSYVGNAVLIACGFAGTYGGLVPKWGPVIVGAAGLTGTFVHQLQQLRQQAAVLPAPDSSSVIIGGTPKQSGRIALMMIAVLLAVTVVLVGCAAMHSLGKKVADVATNPTTAPLVASDVEVAVTTEIMLVHKIPADQAAAAQRYITIAQALEALDQNDVVTLSQLEAAASAQIDAANIPDGDKLAAKNLMTSIAGILLQETQAPAANGAQALTPDMKVAVKSILDDVILAASTFGVHASAVMRADLAR